MSSDDDDDVGPQLPKAQPVPQPTRGSDESSSRKNKKQKRMMQQQQEDSRYLESALRQLPSGQMYEKSWLHRDIVTQVVYCPTTNFVCTGSLDGIIKLWKHVTTGKGVVLEFVKMFLAHSNSAISSISCSCDGENLCSTSSDEQTIRFFLVKTFDMYGFKSTKATATDAGDFFPSASEWISKQGSMKPLVAISDAKSPTIRIYDSTSLDIIHELKPGAFPTRGLSYAPLLRCVVSVDDGGVISYWSTPDSLGEDAYSFPNKTLCPKIKFKLDTDLFELSKKKLKPVSINFGRTSKFVVTSDDGSVRVYDFSTGRIVWTMSMIDDAAISTGGDEDPNDNRQQIETEWLESIKSLEKRERITRANCLFDESERILIVPKSRQGIQMIDLQSKKVVRSIGVVEFSERFCSLSLYQGLITKDYQLDMSKFSESHAAAASANSQQDPDDGSDPILICTSFDKDRFFVFTKREPSEEEKRDVLNEKPTQAQVARAKQLERAKKAQGLPKQAVLHTTLGDVRINLFPQDCPKTVENFVGHCKKHTYNGVIFHRVIRGFMVQTGDPEGDGTGGESIWGGTFEDEFSESLKHDRPFTVSMANCGPNTNGSQFFITTAPQPHLDKKHTVFGRVEVESAQDVVKRIEVVKVDTRDRPIHDVKILSVSLD